MAEPTETPPLLVATERRLRILTLNRPERMNALSPELHHLLQAAVAEAASDPSVGAVVLTGAGRGFCSGGDVRRPRGEGPRESVEERADAIRAHSRTVELLSDMPKPTVALVNGAAAGSGLALALACDIRVMAAGATLRTAYSRVGMSGDLGVTNFLPRIVGAARAGELMLLNPKIDPDSALQLGLVSQIVPDEALAARGLELAHSLAAGPTLAFRYMKQNLRLAERGSLAQVLECEAYNTARVVRTRDVREAMDAFREKRDPVFEGR